MGLLEGAAVRAARMAAVRAGTASAKGGNGPKAARIGDPIQHSSFLAALAGVVAGALIAAAVIGAVGLLLGPIGGLLVGGYLVAKMAGTIASASAAVTRMCDSVCSPDGVLTSGSENVKIEGKDAARAEVDTSGCSKHLRVLIAQGSETVFINSQAAAREGDKLVCGATIKGGASTVLIGSGQGTYIEVEEEFSPWQRALLVAVEFIVPPQRGLLKAGLKLMTKGGRKALFRLAVKEAKNTVRDAKAVVAGAKLAAKNAKAWAQKAVKNPKWAAQSAAKGAKAGAKVAASAAKNHVKQVAANAKNRVKQAGNRISNAGRSMKNGSAKVLNGTKKGATTAGKSVKNNLSERYQSARRGYNETQGAKRYLEATKRFFCKDPIDVTTGMLFDQRIDIELGQTIPLTFMRSWSPGERGLLGENWTDTFSGSAIVNSDQIAIRTTEGACLYFVLMPHEQRSRNPEHPAFMLSREGAGFCLQERNNPVSQHFTVPVPTEEGGIQWQLGALKDVYGNQIQFHYSNENRLVSVTHSDGPELMLLYREDGKLKEIRRSDNEQDEVMVRYGYHDNGWLADADSTQHFHLFYEYNEQGLISRWSDGDQTAVEYQYDAQGRCIYTVGSGGYYPGRFEYEPGITRVIDPDGYVTTWHYNAEQLVTKEISPCGYITRYEYDNWGNLTRKILPEGQTFTLEYLADTGLVTAFTDAMGAKWEYDYDERDRLVQVMAPSGQKWMQHYDDQGQPARFVAPDGSETTLTRNEFGLVTAIEDSDGRKRTQEYDTNHRLSVLFDEDNRNLTLGYDRQDRLQHLKTGGGAQWSWEYDRHHRISLSHRPNSSRERLRHDRHGNLTTWTDARGVAWNLEYGPFDLPVARVDGEGHRWEYRYDKNSLQLIEVINPLGERYRYTLDADGRVITETDYSDTQWHYAYDGNGNCTEKRDALGQITRYLYDDNGKLTEMETPEGTTTWCYDPMGRLLEVAALGTTPLRFEYDEQGRLVKEYQAYGQISHEYPDAFTHQRIVLVQDGQEWQTEMGVNKAGELKRLRISGDHHLNIERDVEANECRRSSNKGFILHQEHSLMGQLTTQRAGRNTEFFEAHEVADIPQPTLAGLDREYRYDAALNLVAANDERECLRYVVNGNGQVTSVSEGERLREHYQYDASGYPSRRFDGLNEIDGERLYQKGHRLRQLGQHLFEYDDAGRMTAMQLWQEGHRPQLTKFRWNSQNQLIGVQTPGGQQWDYRYDAFGRRTEKACERSGLRTTYLWDGDVPAEIREYRHNRLYSIRHLVFDGWQLLAQQVQFFSLNPENRHELMAGKVQTQYAVCAPTGEPLALFDTAGHRVWRQPPQSLYGLRLGVLGENAELNPGLMFAGQWLDEESGLVYNRFRYYSPVAGQYLTPDPIGLLGGENPYAYVHNPTRQIDPLGWAEWDFGKFNEWFNNASVQDIIDNKKSVSAALRGDGGKHEMFPVSLAAKAKELGFTAEELKKYVVDTDKITFTNVTDAKGNPVPDGGHHGSRAGRHFHNKLIADLKNAKSKFDAKKIMVRHHRKHMIYSGKCGK
ncbi:RHS repeat-associated core domain-containing protein [Xenorhabdus sp. KK7.4]|uniref:RHS repeat-associated core domain-containing protein n=1 Tax=Xenorhabdus sp. KK7.4 TaxID=1851572 RepID=UPI000C05E989|nr:RHS repeat-associated core domain-containing protein [Xenorhabdus sp. KK7.4]PHM59281.1 RHS family protein [Xenorhabdus sp. KK7.4]